MKTWLLLSAILCAAPAAAEPAGGAPERPWPLLERWAAGHELDRAPRAAPRAGPDERRARGEVLFGVYCARCHGNTGRGEGGNGVGLSPPPANLVDGTPKVTSTGAKPTELDLFRTITGGLHGTAMPAFADFREADRWALAAYVRSLSTLPERPAIEPGAPPDLLAADRIARGRAAFRTGCGACHEGPAALGPDLRRTVPKRGRAPAALFKAIRLGVPGTSMPPRELPDDEVWALVAYVRSILPERHAPNGQDAEAAASMLDACIDTPAPGRTE